MPKLKRVSGNDIVSALLKLGFSITRQKGSHQRLSRFTIEKSQHVTVPNHKELDRGTEKSIIRRLEEYLSKEEIAAIFYTE